MEEQGMQNPIFKIIGTSIGNKYEYESNDEPK